MQANHCKHVRTFLIRYRSGGTPCVFSSRGVCWNCGPSMREQCLPVPQQPPGSSCCLSLLVGGFRPTTGGHLAAAEAQLHRDVDGMAKGSGRQRMHRSHFARFAHYYSLSPVAPHTMSPPSGRPLLLTPCSLYLIPRCTSYYVTSVC